MNSGRIWWIMLMAFAAIAILVVGAQYYISSMRQALWMQSVREILEITSQSSHSYDIYFRKETNSLANIAHALSRLTPDNEKEILGLLPSPQRNSCYVIVDLKNDIAYVSRLDKSQKLTAEQQVYLETLMDKGLHGPYISSFTGQRFIGSYQRFNFSDGYPGVVLYGQLASTIAGEFPLSFYNNSGFSYVVDKQGNILIRSQHQNSNWTFHNIFEVLERDGNAPEAISEFHQNLLLGRRGVASFRLSGEDYIFAFVPINVEEDWYLVSIVPNAVITAYSKNVARSSEMLSFLMGLAFLILAAFLLMYYLHRRKAKEQDSEIRYREQLFNILANNTNDVFLLLDCGDCSVKYVSPNIERILGIKPEMAGGNLARLAIPGFEAASPTPDLRAMEPGASIRREGEIANADGDQGFFVKTIYKEIIENSARYIVALSDRSMERYTQAALEDALERVNEANAAKSIFLSNMSHDIRTPMNAIMGLATLLRRDANDPVKALQYADKISASSQFLLGLINNVLDMSKIESGKMRLAHEPVNLPWLIAQLDSVIRPQSKDRSQTLRISTKNVFYEKLLGDPLRINQILINLLSNAVKYTDNGGKVSMRVRQRVLDGAQAVRMSFLICDNGIGMSREYMAKIFESFSREHESITNTVQGTGLGMAITRQLVDLMGGHIRVRSEKGKGTSFLTVIDLEIASEIDRNFWAEIGINKMLILVEKESEGNKLAAMAENDGLPSLCAKSVAQARVFLEKAALDGVPFKLFLLSYLPHPGFMRDLLAILDSLPDGSRPLLVMASVESQEDLSEFAGKAQFINSPLFMDNLRSVVEQARKDGSGEGQGKEEAKSFKGKKALIVDDNEMNSDILGEILEMLDIESDVASNGRVCLEMLAEADPWEYDAVLMDVQMPVMNGHEATKAFRASSHPRAKTLPIIAMTANTFDEDVRACRECGMNAHVSKPIDIKMLKQTLAEWLFKDEKEKRV